MFDIFYVIFYVLNENFKTAQLHNMILISNLISHIQTNSQNFSENYTQLKTSLKLQAYVYKSATGTESLFPEVSINTLWNS